ncbi:MAG: cadherin domain-containing protein [Lysobacteraceae bacterium]
MGFFRAGSALILWAAWCASGGAQTYTYSVHVDQDNNPATGCTITTPAGTISGIEAVLSAHVAVEAPRVSGQDLARCQAGAMLAPTPIAGAYAVGFDQGPESFDVIELGAPLAAFGAGAGQSGDWRLVFTSRGALLDGADMTDAVLVQGLGGSAAPTLIPTTSVGALALLALALAIVVVRLGRRHPQLFSVLLVVGAAGLSGLVWAAAHVLDGQIGEWPASPLLTDPANDASADEPPIDIRQVFAAASAGQAHFRIDVSETRLSQLLPAHLESQWSLAENSANGTVLGPVVTDTAGLGAALQLVLDSQLPATAFAFDPSSSQLTVANSGELDFETQPQFELEFSVTAAALPGFSLPWQVWVELSDVNEAPTLAAQSFSVRETAADGSAVGEVVASDPDAGVNGELTFAIIGGSGAAIFAIDAASGQISVADASAITPAQSPFSLEVRVSDGGSPPLDATASMSITVVDVNDPPTFTPGADVEVVEDSAAFDAPWAGAIDDGDGGGQGLEFVLVNSNPTLFSTAPAIDAGTGNLTFTPAADANGSAQITVLLRDDGGTDLGGQDSSLSHLLNISVRPVNDAPGFAASNPPPVLQDSGAAEVAGWAVFDPGAANESTQQVLEYQVSDIDNPALFSVPPNVEAATGTLRYTPATGARGNSGFTVRVRDEGGTADGGEDLSGPQTFTISVEAINNPPSFEPGQNVTVLEDTGAHAVSGWATAIDDGDGGTQVLAFVVQSNSHPGLFAVAPAVDAATGTLTFTPAQDANGSAQITLALRDEVVLPMAAATRRMPRCFQSTSRRSTTHPISRFRPSRRRCWKTAAPRAWPASPPRSAPDRRMKRPRPWRSRWKSLRPAAVWHSPRHRRSMREPAP